MRRISQKYIDKSISLKNKIEHEDLKKEDHTEENSTESTDWSGFSQPYNTGKKKMPSPGRSSAGTSNGHRERSLGLGRIPENQAGC